MKKHEIIVRKKLTLEVFEDIIRDGFSREPVLNMLHFYLGISSLFPIITINDLEDKQIQEEMNLNSLSNWPTDLRKLWLKLNQIFLNPETPLEKIKLRIYSVIKNKYLNMCKLNFPRRA